MTETHYLITLVHGTFAPSAGWMSHGSPLRCALQAGLGGTVEFPPFVWDGKNDHESRARATEELAKQISDRLDVDPHALHAIISHSHGGNIVLRAAADPRVANRLSKLVCMSTPFFVPTKRDVVTAATTLTRAFLWFFGITAWIFVLAFQFTGFSRLNRYGMPQSAGEFAGWIAAAAVALIVALILQRSRRRISAWVAWCQEQRIEELTLPKLGLTPVLCIWAKGDEVLLGFRALDRLASLTLLLLRPSSVVVALVVALVWLAPAGNQAIYKILDVFGVGFSTLIVKPFLPFALLWEYVARLAGINISAALPAAIGVMATMTITLLSIGTWIAAACLHSILKLAPFGMNGWRFIDTFFLRIAPSHTPPDRSGVVAQEMILPRRGLMHSSIYGSDAALQRIVAFIRVTPGPAA
jgi:hypothetical protein